VCSWAETIPGGLSLPEIVPEYMEWIWADRIKQLQIGFCWESLKWWEVGRQEAASSKPLQKTLQPVPLLLGGIPPPRRGGILQGGNSCRPCHKMQLLGTKAMRCERYRKTLKLVYLNILKRIAESYLFQMTPCLRLFQTVLFRTTNMYEGIWIRWELLSNTCE